jgi:large subunit ribosomal protein L28
MAKCDICSKDTVYGNNVSHSVRRTSRFWKPNVKKIRILDGGTPKTVKVCSRCLRSNKVTRAV